MLKPTILNILFYWLVKYKIFYVLMMSKTKNYALIALGDLKTGEDWFYYLLIFLFLPVVCMLVFSAPMYFAFKSKSMFYFSTIIVVILIVEYLFYTWSASQTDLMNGVYNVIISILFLLLFFFRNINSLHTQNTQ